MTSDILGTLGATLTDPKFVQDAVLAASALYAAAAALVGRLQKPISLGTAYFWDRLDGLRHAGMLPFRGMGLAASSFNVFSVAVWLVAIVSVLFLAVAPDRGVALLFGSFAPGTFSTVEIATVRTFFATISLSAAPVLVLSLAILGFGVLWLVVAALIGSKSEPPRWLLGKITGYIFGALIVLAVGGYVWGLYQAGRALPQRIIPKIYTELVNQVGGLSFQEIFQISLLGSVFLTTAVFFWTCCLGIFGFVRKFLPKRSKPKSSDKTDFIALVYVFVAGLVISFLVTTLAARFGFEFQDDARFGLTLQVLLVNAVFDGLTLAVTVHLLNWAAVAFKTWQVQKRLEEYVADFERVGTSAEFPGTEVEHIVFNTRNRHWTPEEDSYRQLASAFADSLLSWHKKNLLIFRDPQFLTSLRSLPSHKASFDTEQERQRVHGQLLSIAKQNVQITSDAIPILKRRFFPALILDAGLAFLFCLVVLFFGFLGTDQALTWEQIWWFATGGFDGQRFAELGPLFWVTHTTFLPTVILWAGLLVMFVLSFVVSRLVDRVLTLEEESDDIEKAARLRVRRTQRSLVKTSTSLAITGGFVSALGFLGVWTPPVP